MYSTALALEVVMCTELLYLHFYITLILNELLVKLVVFSKVTQSFLLNGLTTSGKLAPLQHQ